MAGFFDKIFNGGADEEDFYDDEYVPQQQIQQPQQQFQQPRQQQTANPFSFGGGNRNNQNQTIQQPVSPNVNPSIQKPISVIRAKVYSDAKSIVASLLQGEPVFVDFSSIDESQMNRAIDFISGAVWSTKGNLSKIREDMYLVTPQGYIVQGDVVNTLINGGSSNSNLNPNNLYNR
ncbi:MAG: cell division protein SepF [Lactobacillaceae bacterium]|jgi:cell division inhibitor SepF|nr:cell division protein SepF [Lactobacillaceae bacterium]